MRHKVEISQHGVKLETFHKLNSAGHDKRVNFINTEFSNIEHYLTMRVSIQCLDIVLFGEHYNSRQELVEACQERGFCFDAAWQFDAEQ